MLDWTILGRGIGLSPEAVAIKVLATADDFSFQVGGAANVARNFRSFGAQTALWGVIGDDTIRPECGIAFGAIFRKIIETEKIRWIGEVDARQTTVKLRIEASYAHTSSQQLVRVDLEEIKPYLPKTNDQFNSPFDILNVGDYNKGTVTYELIDIMRNISIEKKIPLIVDPKMGKGRDYFRLYNGVSAITPNDFELAELTGCNFKEDDDGAIGKVGCEYARYLKSDVIITRGRFGCTVCTKENLSTHIPTLPVENPDVVGAGDTFNAVYSLSLACGADQIESAHCAIIASYLVVQKKGTACVTTKELKEEVKRRVKEKIYPFNMHL